MLIICLWTRKLSRTIRLMRFRWTALGTFFLLTMTPKRGPQRLFNRARSVKDGSADRTGFVNTCRYSSLVDRRYRREKVWRISS